MVAWKEEEEEEEELCSPLAHQVPFSCDSERTNSDPQHTRRFARGATGPTGLQLGARATILSHDSATQKPLDGPSGESSTSSPDLLDSAPMDGRSDDEEEDDDEGEKNVAAAAADEEKA